MMEESQDEQAELVTHEEAMLAEKEATEYSQSKVSGSPQVGLSAPSPLPTFLSTSATSSPSPKNQATVPTYHLSEPEGTPKKPQSESKVSMAPKNPEIPADSRQTEVTQELPEVSPSGASSASESLFGWFSNNSLVSRVVEKTKSSMESVITTLDPGMKGVIYSGGDINIAVTSTKDVKVSPIREAFQKTFGKATVAGYDSQTTAVAQPVGFTTGLKMAEERIVNLRKAGSIPEQQTAVSVEGFVVEILQDKWFELSCLVLRDPEHGIELQTFSQPTPISSEYIMIAQDKTPSDYPFRWAGLGVSIGEVIESSQPHIGHADYQLAISGVSRRDSLYLAAQALAHLYKQKLPTSFDS